MTLELQVPYLSAEEGHARRLKLGYTGLDTEDFVRRAEFISLGSYCAVAQAIAYLGKRQRAYPFDWMRCSIKGVIKCFENRFEDFLKWTSTKAHDGQTAFLGSRWGGSFWHYDIHEKSVQIDITRRVARLIDFKDVAANVPRIFVHLLNSSCDLDSVWQLRQTLHRCFPCAPVYILVLIDVQEMDMTVMLEDPAYAGVLFQGMTFESVYTHTGENWVDPAHDIAARSLAYASKIAFAARIWAGGQADSTSLLKCSSLEQLSFVCQMYTGNDPANKLFGASFVPGHRLPSNRNLPAHVAFARLLQARRGEFVLPETVQPGGLLKLTVFGSDVNFRMPTDAGAGQKMMFRLVDDTCQCTLHRADMTGAAIASFSIVMRVL